MPRGGLRAPGRGGRTARRGPGPPRARTVQPRAAETLPRGAEAEALDIDVPAAPGELAAAEAELAVELEKLDAELSSTLQVAERLAAIESRPAAAVPVAARAAARPSFFLTGAAVLQSAALVGSLVTGVLARKRRLQVEALLKKQKDLNTQRRQTEAGRECDGGLREVLASFDADSPVVEAVRAQLQQAEAGPAKYGVEFYVAEGKKALRGGQPEDAITLLKKGLVLAESSSNQAAKRAALLAMAVAHEQQGRLDTALELLFQAAGTNLELEESAGSHDVYGLIADIYTEQGEYEQAAVFYDKAITSMAAEAPDDPGLSSFDIL